MKDLIDRLMAAGHDVEVLAEAYSDTMGHAGAVVLHPDGSLEGVHDPRADGGAAGVSDGRPARRIGATGAVSLTRVSAASVREPKFGVSSQP